MKTLLTALTLLSLFAPRPVAQSLEESLDPTDFLPPGYAFVGPASIDGDRIALLAEDHPNVAALVLERRGSTWVEEELFVGDGESGFGATIDLDGDTLLLGDSRGFLSIHARRDRGDWPLVRQVRVGTGVLENGNLAITLPGVGGAIFARTGSHLRRQASVRTDDVGLRPLISSDLAAITVLQGPARLTAHIYPLSAAGVAPAERIVLEDVSLLGDDGVALFGTTLAVVADDQRAVRVFDRATGSWNEDRITPPGEHALGVAGTNATLLIHSLSGGRSTITVYDRQDGLWWEGDPLVQLDPFIGIRAMAADGPLVALTTSDGLVRLYTLP